jgi:hypothetical protein
MLIGLTKRHPLCKVCTCFSDDDLLNEITLDLLYGRRTYEEIIEHYNKFLPEQVDTLTATNLSNHKRHSDPALIAEENLKSKGQAITEGDFAAILYSQRFKDRVDKQDVLHSLYKARINSIQYLRTLLTEKQDEHSELRIKAVANNKDFTYKQKLKNLEGEIRGYIKQIDDLESDIQSVVLQDMKVEKGPGNTYINNNNLNMFQGNLNDFLSEFIPYLLMDVFKDDIEKGKEVVSHLSASMDTYLAPIIKKLNQVSAR